MPNLRLSHTQRAFTLIELLVVLVIVAVLTGIALPVIHRVKQTGDRTACLANMRQLGSGIQLYCNEHNGRFPFTTHAGSEDSWIQTIQPYVGDVSAIRTCPSDPRRAQIAAEPERGSSYAINELVARPEVEGSVSRIQQVARPADLAILFEKSNSRSITTDHVHTSRWFNASFAQAGLVWPLLANEVEVERHRGGANYLFADGHAESIQAKQLQTQIEEGQIGPSFGRP